MADRKLSSVSEVSDMNFVYAETETGETVKISKEKLIELLSNDLKGVKSFTVKGTNTGVLYADIKALVGSSFKAPLKWEFTGCQWGSSANGYAYGLCRYDTDSGGTSASVIHNSGFTGTPSASVGSDGVLTFAFGMQWSAAKLTVYY